MTVVNTYFREKYKEINNVTVGVDFIGLLKVLVYRIILKYLQICLKLYIILRFVVPPFAG